MPLMQPLLRTFPALGALTLCPACLPACNGGSGSLADAPATAPFKSEACVVPPRPLAEVQLKPVFQGLEVETPVALVQAPTRLGASGGRWFIADQHGIIHSFLLDSQGAAVDIVSTDLTDRVAITTRESLDERGLLGIALHPQYPADPRAFLAYTTNGGAQSRVSSFDVASGKLNPESETVLIEVDQPWGNHNGGHVAFGPDGLLYSSLGDGGNGGDPLGHGQNKDTLLGSIIRVDVNRQERGKPYGIPPDNPFAAGGGAPEIYAYGLRNAWRFSFDRDTGTLWAGDVGQDLWEEVHTVEKGGNYGWNIWEGPECFPPEVRTCSEQGFEPPVHAYRHPGEREYRSVTGGFVYRGSRLPEMVGKYLFADWVTGEVWTLLVDGQDVIVKQLLQAEFNVSSFAESQDGELYLLDRSGGRVLGLYGADGVGGTLPAMLTDTGCVHPNNPRELANNAIPYDVIQPFWSDGVEKRRYVVLPEGTQLILEDQDYELPPGGMVIKNFVKNDTPFETRFYVRHEDGEYSGYSFRWLEDGSDAELVESTHQATVAGQEWLFLGRDLCHQCHTAAAGRTLGLEAPQLRVQGKGEEQLTHWLQEGIVDRLPEEDLPLSPLGGDDSITAQARSYLHVNCSTCHRPKGPGRGGLDLRYGTPLADTGLCGVAQLGDAGTRDGLLVVPGDPSNSVLWQRVAADGPERMPPLASRVVDGQGVDLLERWIRSVAQCEP